MSAIEQLNCSDTGIILAWGMVLKGILVMHGSSNQCWAILTDAHDTRGPNIQDSSVLIPGIQS